MPRINFRVIPTALFAAATLLPVLAHAAHEPGPLEQRQKVQAALKASGEVKHSGFTDRNSHWEFHFFKGDAPKFSRMLTDLAAATAPHDVELILHEGNGKTYMSTILKAWGGPVAKNLANRVAGDGKHQFAQGRPHEPPMPLSGEPFAFDWCVDVRQALGPGIPPPEYSRICVTAHLFIGERADLFQVDVPENVKITPGGRVGEFIWRTEMKRKHGKDTLRKLGVEH